MIAMWSVELDIFAPKAHSKIIPLYKCKYKNICILKMRICLQWNKNSN